MIASAGTIASGLDIADGLTGPSATGDSHGLGTAAAGRFDTDVSLTRSGHRDGSLRRRLGLRIRVGSVTGAVHLADSECEPTGDITINGITASGDISGDRDNAGGHGSTADGDDRCFESTIATVLLSCQ